MPNSRQLERVHRRRLSIHPANAQAEDIQHCVAKQRLSTFAPRGSLAGQLLQAKRQMCPYCAFIPQWSMLSDVLFPDWQPGQTTTLSGRIQASRTNRYRAYCSSLWRKQPHSRRECPQTSQMRAKISQMTYRTAPTSHLTTSRPPTSSPAMARTSMRFPPMSYWRRRFMLPAASPRPAQAIVLGPSTA